MELIKQMNQALAYLEENLSQDVDLSQLTKIACCPNYHFNRVFSLFTGISLTEYLRKRILSEAAQDLKLTDDSIMEIALKYGYNSHSAFARAFKEFHQITPSNARRPQGIIQSYPPIKLTMAYKQTRTLAYRLEKLAAFSLTGYSKNVSLINSAQEIACFWQELKRCHKLRKLVIPQENNFALAYVGILANGDWQLNDSFTYSLTTANPINSSQLKSFDFISCDWVVFSVDKIQDFPTVWQAIYTNWLMNDNYQLLDIPALECYYAPNHYPQNEIWLPVIKKGE